MATIAVLPGDGIGPEVTAAAVRVLSAVRPDLELVECLVGGAALRAGDVPMPKRTKDVCDRAAAILFGAVGGLEFDGKPIHERPEHALLTMRKEYDLFVNIRPVKVFAGLENASTLQPEIVRGLDLVVLRELTGGLYYGHKETTVVEGERRAVDTLVYKESEIERIAHAAFELARRRRKHVTSVDKLNVLETSRLWRSVVERVAPAYPDVRLAHMLVDNAAMQLVRNPGQFDVMVMENTFGDILSDEAAMLTGSLGNLPSASIGARNPAGGQFGLFEPISGTAPDIAGKGIANPTAAILSAALLCRLSLDDERSAQVIEAAVEGVFAAGGRTADLTNAASAALSTAAFTDRVLANLTTRV